MIDDHDLFERAVERFAPPERSFERLVTRRGRKQRNKRIRAGVVAFVVVAVVAGVFLPSFRSVVGPRGRWRDDRRLPSPARWHGITVP